MDKDKRAKKWLENIDESKNLTRKEKLAVCAVASKKFNWVWVCVLLALAAGLLTYFKLSGGVRLQDGFTAFIIIALLILMFFALVKLRNYLIKRVITDGSYKDYIAKEEAKKANKPN